jgi:hypothetical protein
MRNHRFEPVLSATLTLLLTLVVMACAGGRDARAADDGFNACGCRQDGQGLCVCEKKSKCGCPGECEPKGCDERRAKLLEKEIQAETKKAEDSARKQNQGHNHSDDGTSGAESDQREQATAAPSNPKSARPKMSGAQKKELARLLGLYLADHPDEGERAAEQIRNDLASGAASRSK